MTFLPIVARELRAAARSRATYRTRTISAVLASILAAGLVVVGSFASNRPVGSGLFRSLAGLGGFYALLCGIRHASDALSEEKREGTLGLLFLTDLHSFDVVAGKLVSISTRSLQQLLAFIPVLAIGLLLGGMTGGEFWRCNAVLLSTLFFSLAVGLSISAVSRESHRALAATTILLGVATFLPLAIRTLSAPLGIAPLRIFLSALSPAALLSMASDSAYHLRPGEFAWALALNHAFAWALLAFASVILPRVWQERPNENVNSASAGSSVRLSRPHVKSLELRRRLLESNPILWLAARHQGQRLCAWMFVAITLAAGMAVAAAGWAIGGTTLGTGTVLGLVLGTTLKLWVAWQACATLAEAKRSGAIELVLATPVSTTEIVDGQWKAMQRLLLWPAIAVLVLRALPALVALRQSPPAPPLLLWISIPGTTLFGLITYAIDLLAIAWMGMWMGIRQKGPLHAFTSTVVLTILVPAVLFCLPNLVFDLLWISWARQQLERCLRRTASEPNLRLPRPSLNSVLPPPPDSLPPVIQNG